MNPDSQPKNFTYQEIIRQQSGWEKALAQLEMNRPSILGALAPFRDRVWVFCGCGSSYYLAQTAGAAFEMITGIRTRVVPASEILMLPELVFNPRDSYLLVSLSRSGTTTETVRATQKARNEFKLPVLAVSCNPASTLNRESEIHLSFPFEPERSVVMTGSFTTMLLSVIYTAYLLSSRPADGAALMPVPDASRKVMQASEAMLRELVSGPYHDFVFLGQGALLGIANEAALKMQEMAISVSQGYHSLEYRHGPMSTVTGGTLLTILSSSASAPYDAQLARDMKKLGARVLLLTGASGNARPHGVDEQIEIPGDFGDMLIPLLYMPLLQMLAYYRAISQKIDPDNPKNLSQVVELDI